MAANMEQAIAWMEARRGKVTYSMDYRNGPNSYDCSSSVYFALMSAGAITAGWAVNTEYMHDWLIKNGFKLIAENSVFAAQRGDIFIWGRRGQSSGAGGHTGIFVDSNNIIHCNYARNGITVDNYLATAHASGNMYYYIYRPSGQSTVSTSTAGKSIDQLVQETLAGKYGNGDQRKAALGPQYQAVMDRINGKASAVEKSDEELAKEVLAGKHGNGEDRKRSLGPRYPAVQKKVDELLKKPASPQPAPKVEAPKVETPKQEPAQVQVQEDGDLSFNGAVLKSEVLKKILAKCKEHDILPSYALTILHYEGLWGTSAVGKVDNNWGGMTWTGQGNRPSGVTVTQGTARPSNEGGHYMHYASVDDFLTDWFYLLRLGGSYKVSGAKTFSEAIKGMFKTGGAVYDYAATGYDNYLVGMSSRLKAIEAENGSLDKFDKQTVTDVGSTDKIEVNIEGIEISINGVTYTLSKKPV
ncbi:TPA: glucosaminidase domain-containing protein [Streptococcus suis]|uniref:peptidoglycan amidohydrolase family protein n=1 Tax=Streptococcus suis TaxID=1307 RepID=UPI000CF66D86|nr:peptidoglycan amidohydrolase family protein [Streptococcus suis]HEM5272504.1 glucosaminidase domain-containing protein [Streptococcus suis]HEM6241194.1 glucosaminidase domain-containing protein [Streptococcus suis]HEM6295136.1 glucosaminidase domain-containing protein [Streptococcus suis]HEM6418875.1 glucosaminidase domain-containing protein [Streptococcus suis]HEM6424740.1 glucosaminidase domain-containing protein [Streptococcus suis]